MELSDKTSQKILCRFSVLPKVISHVVVSDFSCFQPFSLRR
jgi:hypothetical protein